MPTLLGTFYSSYNTRSASAIGLDELKRVYLFGLPLTNQEGEELDDASLQLQIDYATGMIQREVDVVLIETEFNDRQDWFLEEWKNWGFLLLPQKPVLSISSLKGKYPLENEIIDFPLDWISISKDNKIHIVPGGGSLAAVIYSGYGGVFPIRIGGSRHIPDFFNIIYKAGYEYVPPEIKVVVAKLASIGVLNILGDILLGAGIASESLGIDGLSQSINTTQSAENSAYSARIKQYLSELKKEVPALRKTVTGLLFDTC